MAAGVNERFSTSTEPSGWIIPVAIQAVVPIAIFVSPLFIRMSKIAASYTHLTSSNY
jgi:hypothetical protein